ncbi:GILT-like protein C02D5.2 [Copidosoma floridanum]|uniref:GILT-like protein C02D5.2 n=1 Tax=Copidosoma floridanum TaxID=29053 RepID=UPI0006C97793|nr:GILT-like protein C02D5.2 [Copidosoma floridanum]
MKSINSMRLKLLLVVFVILLFWQSSKLWSLYGVQPEEVRELIEKQSVNQQILVNVYYEALCPDSRNFILKQLVPTFNSIEDYIELQLIPYGKAKTRIIENDFEFECQHGPVECEANIYHACTVNKISDSRKQLKLIACMIKDNTHPSQDFVSCGSTLPEYESIKSCAQSTEGRRLLSKFGQVTDELEPKVSFIPTITFDNEKNNESNLIPALKNLKHEICKRLKDKPRECRR